MTGNPCELINRILDWWRTTGGDREYPWRRDSDPYKSIVSEILLTRTKRRAVAKIYDIFFHKFPTPETLASANEEEILGVLGSLGLSKRVKILKRLGVKLSNGFPSTSNELTDFPGIGKYSQNLLSLKLFGSGELPVDKIVGRTLLRLFLGEEPKTEKPENDNNVLRIASEISKCSSNLLEIAYAIMDLGDEVCKPKKPLCNVCPVQELCLYNKGEDF